MEDKNKIHHHIDIVHINTSYLQELRLRVTSISFPQIHPDSLLAPSQVTITSQPDFYSSLLTGFSLAGLANSFTTNHHHQSKVILFKCKSGDNGEKVTNWHQLLVPCMKPIPENTKEVKVSLMDPNTYCKNCLYVCWLVGRRSKVG